MSEKEIKNFGKGVIDHSKRMVSPCNGQILKSVPSFIIKEN